MAKIIIDTTKVMVLLIGVSKYPEDATITPIPNVERNIEQLRKSLLHENILGVPEQNMFISLNETKMAIERKIVTIGRETKNKQYTLFVYYSGHGILSCDDFKLYLTTRNSTKAFLETDGISIEVFQKFMRKSHAGRKIVILDACHSGQIHNAMGEATSQIVVELSKFQGTYVLTSASETEPSLFPANNPDIPTYFTGKLLEIIQEGLPNNKPYITLSEVYAEIVRDFRERGGLPIPQQSVFKNADELVIAKNKLFNEIYRIDYEWNTAVKQNTVEAFKDFITTYPESDYKVEAEKRIETLTVLVEWQKVVAENSVYSYSTYIQNNPYGKFVTEALQKISEIEELAKYNEALNKNTIASYFSYKNSYPDGVFIKEINEKLNELIRNEKEKRLWVQAIEEKTPESYQRYLMKYPDGNNAHEAKMELEHFENEQNKTSLYSNVEIIEDIERTIFKTHRVKRIVIAIFVILAIIIISFHTYFITSKDKNEVNYKMNFAVETDKIRKNNRSVNKMIMIQNQFDTLIKAAKTFENMGEAGYVQALALYKQAERLNINKNQIVAKIDTLSVNIKNLFEKYKYIGDIFLNADGDGKKKALDNYMKAHNLKPKDSYVNQKIKELK